jgi:hypothetical protein
MKMKKVVRMLGLCALVALALTSCKKKETNSNMTFKATISQPASDSRTHINEADFLAWDEGDIIKVFDNAGENNDFTVSSIGNADDYLDHEAVFEVEASKAEFIADIVTSGLYTAYYPSAEFVNATQRVKIEVPSDQNFASSGSILPNTYPMYATNEGNNFPFHSNAGILRIKLRKNTNYTEDVYVTKLVLRADNDALAGEMFYPYDDPASYQRGTTCDVITLNCVTAETPDGIKLDTQDYNTKTFHFVVLENALQGAFSVDIYTDNPNVPFETLTAGTMADHKIEAETITEMGQRAIPLPPTPTGD